MATHHPGCMQRNDPNEPCTCISKHGRPPRRPTSTNKPNSGKGSTRRPGGKR